ncbi:MAG: hypothetical protein EYC70_07455 [Planctomycetota bacterium]|nr:MAG: hypothetical protein EYC70_07455 [Planctomycetota bacterium]
MRLLASILIAPTLAAAALAAASLPSGTVATEGQPDGAGGSGRALNLNLFGNCPGPMAFLVSGARPDSTIAFLWSFGTGSATIQGGRCAGTVLGLDANARFGGAALADANGDAFWPVTGVPPSACGRAFVQALEIAGCVTSNVVRL